MASQEPTEHRSFQVLMTCGAFEPGVRRGGPIRSAARIVDTVPAAIDLRLVAADRDAGDRVPYPALSGRWVARGRSRVFYLDQHSVGQWLRLYRAVRSTEFDLLYLNSVWEPTFTLIPVLAIRLGLIRARSVLLAPRGELSPGALSIKSRKKHLYLSLFLRLLANLSVVWHASADREAREIAAVVPGARIEISPDQVALPAAPIPPPYANPDLRLVFISRISPKKNLDIALHALQGLSLDIAFDIYGPIDDAPYWSKCQAQARTLSPAVRVTYRGELAPADVAATFSSYDAFVFPTLGENFGHVIAESLSASCPVVCADTTPWSGVLRNGGGIVLDELTQSCLREVLESLAHRTAGERLELRLRAGDAYRRWRENVGDENILGRLALDGSAPAVP